MSEQRTLEQLFDALEREPYAHDFLHLLRQLECLYPERPRIGRALRPADEAVRLGQEPALSFAPASLSRFTPATDKTPPKLDVRFFGLLGPNGPLPLHLTEYARNRSQHSGDRSLERFLDIFHHRFLALFYRAWAQAQPTVSLDRPDEDRFGMQLGALFGMGSPALRDRTELPDSAKLFNAGLFARDARNPEGLEGLLRSYFRVPVRVECFVGNWMPLPDPERTRLGRTNRLGVSAVAGRSVWDRQHKFRIHLGPLHLADYERFLPGGHALRELADAVRSYVGFEYEWDLRLALDHHDRPAARSGRRVKLGWTTWLGRREPEKDPADLVLHVERLLKRHARKDSRSTRPAEAMA